VSRGAFTLASIVVLVGLRSALAQPARADASALRACFEGKSERQAEACIDTVAKDCANAEGNEYDSTMRDCRRREQQAWDIILNESYQRLRGRLPAKEMIKLRAAQRTWLKARQQQCDRFYAFFQGTMAHPMIAACENRETARRALFLLAYARRAGR
jgi:uncharacterized protein YecT (DUF1311 family)